MPTYSKEQLWPLYENLPEDLKKAIFSEETADIIYNICLRSQIENDVKIAEVSRYTGYVLLGVLLPAELEKTLVKDAFLQENAAKQIAWEINRFVFLPIKISLEALYKTEIVSEPKSPGTTFPTSATAAPTPKTKPTSSAPDKDTYRESIE